MPKVVFIAHDGKQREVEASADESVMRAAVVNNVPGIDADCGGECACATCHVYVDADWADRLPPPSEMEASMLAFVDGAQPNSRLSCQIKATAEIDGLVVNLPKSQH